ncbi:UDP-3-O-(3-hydroxymyristoyl)glucosamine N-acyltransferase [Coraliomargarita akajimensis]|uniref:UDP-3-O-acylglucosamine N-acyltransferase n=1 Tax=Coraliomargarita akajimensis (strain DSM 45221 / IAM 15411 / JCM 23193 / KCTC 12865 / 04OKA010-24) TaxID=583355 RepID=D5EJK1_CORAD|nr:UDP-3-O-(3-hydroxymyristoyl)glucosamine N-acyltransferase [Coraliomargarita akajimensis]ADE54600.1 UDP-3-O-(3-hydroxymyristoyl) glucosamine N- acyltransferase [Coraliomargarita akajimensis DSM 45221]
MELAYSIERILEIIGPDAECVGQYDGAINGLASLSEATTGDLSFLGNSKYRHEVADSAASVLLLPMDYTEEPKSAQLFIRVENPSFALALICEDIELLLSPKPPAGIHPSAVVEAGAEVSAEASIGAFCYIAAGAKVGAAVLDSHVSIGRNAVIGDGSHLFPRVVIGEYCEIGPENRIQAGAVIGSDGYGYEFKDGFHQRVPQIGRVVTEARVDIGANSTIDRARFGQTLIGEGTKVDNLVQIAHNVKLGKHCLLVAQVGVSGSTEFGNGVVAAGQAGFGGHIKIGDGAVIGAQAGTAKSLPAGAKVRGTPAMSMDEFGRQFVMQRKLPDLFKRIDQLEKSVESLRSTSEPSE